MEGKQMRIKKYYIAVQICQGEKYSAAVLPVTECDNIFSKLAGIPGIVAANIYDTNKQAAAVVLAWVDGFRAAGCYMWDTMPDGSPAPF
jgi:hypothetical protein